MIDAMPATSKKQRELMAIAEHHPSEVSAKNRGVLKMSKQQLHDFAATSEKRLPERSSDRQSEAVKKQTGGHPTRMAGRHDGGEFVTEHHRGARRR